MAEFEMEKAKMAPDEVDLVAAFVSFVNFFRKNGLILLLSMAIGLGLGGLYFKLKPKQYSSKMVAECMSLPDTRVVELINSLEEIRKNGDWDQLAAILNLTPEEAKSLKKFKPQSNVAIDKISKGVDDYLLNTHDQQYSFSVTVLSKDNTIWPKIQMGLVNYLANNEFSKTRVNRFIENKTIMISFIDKEIKRLDSLGSFLPPTIIRPNSPQTDIFSPAYYNAKLVDLAIELQEKKQTKLDELKFAIPVRVILPFYAYRNPVEPNLIPSLGIGLVFGLGFGLVIIILRGLSDLYRKNTSQ